MTAGQIQQPGQKWPGCFVSADWGPIFRQIPSLAASFASDHEWATRSDGLSLGRRSCNSVVWKQLPANDGYEVIERHTKAMGGRAAIEAIQSIEIDLHIADPKFEVDGTYFAARPGKMRIDVNAGG